MTEMIRTQLNPDNKPGHETEVHLPPGITEDEALSLAREQVWELHRNLVCLDRMQRTRTFLINNPEIDRELAEIIARPESWQRLKNAFQPYRRGYSTLDPIHASTNSGEMS